MMAGFRYSSLDVVQANCLPDGNSYSRQCLLVFTVHIRLHYVILIDQLDICMGLFCMTGVQF